MLHAKTRKSALLGIAFTAITFGHGLTAQAQDSALFATYDDASIAAVETVPYREIVSALSVEERGRTLIAYDAARAQALPFFEDYVAYLSSIPVHRLNRDEQLAYWLNTRNILLIQALSEERRVTGFKRKRGTPEIPGAFWTKQRITVSGTSLSIQDIETQILFAGWDEPNIIYGLYQGMRGGPALPRTPFSGSEVHSQLAAAASKFTSDSDSLRVRGDSVRVSTYFEWYLPLAFGGSESALRRHLAGFVSPEQTEIVSSTGKLQWRNLSTAFEQFRARQIGASGGASSGGFGS